MRHQAQSNRRLCLIIAIFALSAFCACPAFAAPAPPPATRPAPFENEILAFEQADRQQAPPAGANLFIGSSSLRLWKTMAADFSGYSVINRGFGGSRIADCTRYVDRIVIPYHPGGLFFYAGDNDLAAGHPPEQALADFKEFVAAVQAALPDSPIYFIAIKPSVARLNLLESARKANALISGYISTEKGLHYIDIFTPMLGPDGKPRPEIFGPDKLHMNRAGYEIWIPIIKPLLK